MSKATDGQVWKQKKARRPKKIQPTSFAEKKTVKTQRLYSVNKKYDAEKNYQLDTIAIRLFLF